MFFSRQRFALSLVSRLVRFKTWSFLKNQQTLICPTHALSSVRYTFSSTLSNREENLAATPEYADNALTQVRTAERNRLNIRILDPSQQKTYFDNLWRDILADKFVKTPTIARFLHLKYDFGQEFSYEETLADIKKLGLKPDAIFFSVFIRKACENGDMDATSSYLKAMHQEGAVPNDYIFSKILHGYVKCGLPDEVASTQDVMSKLNYWPSILATENLLSAYADLGDGNSVIELLQETLKNTESNRPAFSSRFLADLYARLVVTPNDTTGPAASMISTLLKKRSSGYDDYRIGNVVANLLTTGHSDDAFQLLRDTRPHVFSTNFLSHVPELLEGQGAKVLNEFWSSSGTFGRLPQVIQSMTDGNMLRTLRANPPLRIDVCNAVANAAVLKATKKKDVEMVVELGKILFEQRFHLLYLTVIPRLLALGLKPEEVLAKFEAPSMKSCGALGIVLNELCALPSFWNPPTPGTSLENAEKFVGQFQKDQLLPFTEYLSVNSNFIHLLLRGCAHYVYRNEEVDQDKLDKWTSLLFSCFSADRHPLLTSALLRFCGPITSEKKSSEVSRFSLTDQQTRKALAHAFVTNFTKQKIPVSYLDDIRKILKDLQLPNELIASLVPAGNLSLHSILLGKIQAGEIEDVIEKLKQMQKSISQETSPLGSPLKQNMDLLGEALALSTTANGVDVPKKVDSPLRFTAQQLENLFWALIDVAGLKSPSFSAIKIGEQYLNAADMDGLVAFLNKVASRCPYNLSAILSRWFVNKAFQLDADRTGQALEEILQGDNVTFPTMVLGAFNYEMVAANAKDKKTPLPDLGVRLLSKRLESFNQLRKVRTVHLAIEELCQKQNIFAAYALRDWAYKAGLSLLPQTTETLLASHVFVNPLLRIPTVLLSPSRLTLRGGISLTSLIPRLQDAVAMASPVGEETSPESTAAAIEAASSAITEHPFVVNPNAVAHSLRSSAFKKAQFAFWSVVDQVIDAPGSRLSLDENLALLATKLVSAGHEAAVLTWISCLLRKERIAALCCGGLISPNTNFVELLDRRPDLQFAVATSPALSSLTAEQKDEVSKNFAALHRSSLLKLASALGNKEYQLANSIIDELKDEGIFTLAGLVNAQPKYLPLIVEAMKERPLEWKIALVNEILDGTQTYKAPLRLVLDLLDVAARPNMQDGEKPDYKCLKDRISTVNQVFLRVFMKTRTTNRGVAPGFATGTEYLDSILPGPANASLRNSIITATKLGRSQAIIETLLSLQKSSFSKLKDVARCVMLSHFLTSNSRSAITILFSIAHQRNVELLDLCASTAAPFLHNSFGVAFKGLVDIFRQRDVDPVIYEAISFHRLGEFTVPPAQSLSAPKIESLSLNFDKSAGVDVSDPIRLAKESVNCLAATLADEKLSTENVHTLISVVRKLWGPGRIDLLLCHLVDMTASKSVEQVIESMPLELRERRLPFKTLCSLITINTGDVFDENRFKEAVDFLKTSPSPSLTLCMNGPHVATLFATWPDFHINQALEIIDNALDRSQPLLRLQLAAALVQRGLVDKAAPVLEVTGPLPFNYLAGSLQHPLNKSSFHHSFQYLKRVDSEHLPAFVDASLRNAAMSTRLNPSTEAAVSLVEAAIEEAPADWNKYCQPSTLRLLREATKQSKEIQQLLLSKSPTDGEN